MSLFELQGVSFEGMQPWDVAIEAGECIGLSGPSGSGKSRLLRAMADLDAHRGEALLEGRRCRDYAPGEWRARVGLLAAESAWWCERIGEHFPHPPAADRLAALGFTDACLGWTVSRCSTGERQRLALLRLLENGPHVLLLDEPTASLDPESVRAVETMVRDYLQQQGAAAIWVGHDGPQLQRMTTRRYRIDADRVVEEGGA